MSLPDTPDESDASAESEASGGAPPTRTPKLVVVGGGPGGIGRTLLASSLGVCLAQLGRRVIVVDADAMGGGLAHVFGFAPQDIAHGDFAQDAPMPATPTRLGGLFLTRASQHVSSLAGLRGARKTRFIATLSRSECDFIIVDAGGGHGPLVVDLMLAADLPVLVTVPEPRAIASASAFLRAAYLRSVHRRIGRDPLGRPVVARALAETGGTPSRHALTEALARIDRRLADVAGSIEWSPMLVVNQTRVKSDIELGAAMRVLLERHDGLTVQDVGHVEYDEACVQSARKCAPLLLDNPTAKAARNVERVVRRLVNGDERVRPTEAAATAATHYAMLGVDRAASDEEIRRAAKRQRELYGADSLAAMTLLPEATLIRERHHVEVAAATLLDPVKRKAYDTEQYPIVIDAETQGREARVADSAIVSAVIDAAGPGAVITGSLLRRVREACGFELADISARTKVSRLHLEALEEEDFARLPPPVYVRGIVIAFAKALRMDHVYAERSYMARLREKTA